MRAILLIIAGALLGALGGMWQAYSFVPVRQEVVGSDLDEAQRKEIEQSGATAEEIAKTGVIPAALAAKVEVVGGTDFDFGTMKRGTSRSHKFIFRNTGNAPLKLWVQDTTCKCTVGSVDENYIQPGEETPVELTWTADGVLPDFAQTATIGTTDPSQEEVKLTITGRIGTNYVIFPDSLSLDEFSSYETVTKDFKVYSFEDTEFKCSGFWDDVDLSNIVEVTSEIRRLEKGEVPQFADARYVADMQLIIQPGFPAGPINNQIRLMVGPDELRMSLPVTGRCVSELRIVGSSDYDEEKNLFRIGSIDGETGLTKKFFLTAQTERRDVELKFKEFAPKELNDALKVEIGEPIVTPRKLLYPISLIVPPGTGPIDRDGSNPNNYAQMTFTSNLEHSPQISVYLQFKVE